MKRLLIILFIALSVPVFGQLKGVVASQSVGGVTCTYSEEEYCAVYNAMSNKPTSGIADAQNTLVKALVDAGIWAKLDVFYCFAQYSNTGGEALINWVSPGTNNASNVHATAFVSLEGFTSDGANDYINSNYNPSTDATHYALDDASVGWYNRVAGNPAATSAVWGIEDPTDLAGAVSTNTGVYYMSLNSTGTDNITFNGTHSGFFISTRANNTQYRIFKNTTTNSLLTENSVAIPNADFYILANNVIGTGATYFHRNAQISFWFVSSTLSTGERDTLSNAIEAYMDSNGKGVI